MVAVKIWFQRFRPLRLYAVVFLTAVYFCAQLIVSHFTHALTLLVDSYHVLCNLIALIGCIITVKYGSCKGCNVEESTKNNSDELKILSAPIGSVKYASKNCQQQEKELRNTFGWARIDVLVMLIGCVFLASLCFSLLVEALQTLIHISHLDAMHHPIPILYIGFIGLALNILCYFLIGGYTYHQGSFLHVTEDGDVVLESVNENSVSNGQRRLSSQTRRVHVPLQPPKRQSAWETCRDIIGCLLVILCATLVSYTDKNIAKYIDPIISIISAILLLVFSYPYMKESCLILLQTIPDHINMGSLEMELFNAFPNCIVNIHDFHVWQLTVNKTISTVHIIFINPHVYIRVNNDIKKFFHDHGISHVTVQPEFYKDMNSVELISSQCLVTCTDERCIDSQCCSSSSDLRSISISSLTKPVKNQDNVNPVKGVKERNTSISLPSSVSDIFRKEKDGKNPSHLCLSLESAEVARLGKLIVSKTNQSNGEVEKDFETGSRSDSLKSELVNEGNKTKKKTKIEKSNFIFRKRCMSEPIQVTTVNDDKVSKSSLADNNKMKTSSTEDVVSIREPKEIEIVEKSNLPAECTNDSIVTTACNGNETMSKVIVHNSETESGNIKF